MATGRHLGAALASVFALASQAQAGTTIATWVQIAPGSSPAALAAGSWGDQPLSQTNTVLVRAVVTDATACPAATLDHSTPLTLKQRFISSSLTNTPGSSGATNGKAGYPQYFVSSTATSPANFPDGTAMATTSWGECEAVVPAGSFKTVTVDGTNMKLPVAHPKRILVYGDSGCRLNGSIAASGANQQNCSSPAAFPFAYLSAYEATFKPDVILQVGDWFYRDTNCLSNGVETFTGCNTPTSINYETWGDTFDSWNHDVFFPAKTLLAAAPWIMERGNHESCGRGARGWFATLDPYPYNYNNVVCAYNVGKTVVSGNTPVYTGDFDPTYVAPINGVNYLVHDSSFASDSPVDTNMAKNYDLDLTAVLAALPANTTSIFTTHKPPFGLSYSGNPGVGTCATGPSATSDESGDWTEQAMFNGGTSANSAFVNGVPSSIALFLSGHVHQFQYLNIGTTGSLNTRFPPQLIVGTGGSLLDPDCNTGSVPSGVTDVATFSQQQEQYLVQNDSNGTSSTNSNTFSHDEFGFALFETIADSNGNVTGYNAEIYKVSSARAGVCKILFNPRSITCHL